MLRRLILAAALLFSELAAAAGPVALPSWNDGPTKNAIIDFVDEVTTEGSASFVPVEDRIAVFDNDGTLWSEQPYYFQLGFIVDRVKALAPEHPEWKLTEPFKSIIAGDLAGLAASGEKGLVALITATHAGMTTEEFARLVAKWFATSRHPRFHRPYDEITFLPMLELLDYLRGHGFKTYIASGGGIEFMRVVTERIYGIPPEQVIGSSIVTRYAVDGETPVLRREAEIDFVDDNAGKPVGINKFIGRRPIFAAGNSDGDYEMLRWVTASGGPHFGMIVHHTDAIREWAYDRDSAVGRLARALDESAARNWTVVDMRKDWRRVFSFEP